MARILAGAAYVQNRRARIRELTETVGERGECVLRGGARADTLTKFTCLPAEHSSPSKELTVQVSARRSNCWGTRSPGAVFATRVSAFRATTPHSDNWRRAT